jgi:hypothetical protein
MMSAEEAAIASPAAAVSSVSDTSAIDSSALKLPYITDIENKRVSAEDRKANANCLWGTFAINNAYRQPFILRLTFESGGALQREERLHKGRRSISASIGVRDAVLRYARVFTGESVERPLAKTEHRGGGYVYEVRFENAEDVQGLYKMELWAALSGKEADTALVGVYRETVRFEILGLTQ